MLPVVPPAEHEEASAERQRLDARRLRAAELSGQTG